MQGKDDLLQNNWIMPFENTISLVSCVTRVEAITIDMSCAGTATNHCKIWLSIPSTSQNISFFAIVVEWRKIMQCDNNVDENGSTGDRRYRSSWHWPTTVIMKTKYQIMANDLSEVTTSPPKMIEENVLFGNICLKDWLAVLYTLFVNRHVAYYDLICLEWNKTAGATHFIIWPKMR